MQRLALYLSLLFLLSACQVTGPTGVSSPAPPTPTLPPALPASTLPPSAPTVTPAALAPAAPSRPHYDLDLTLDLAGHLADVRETVTYPNRTGAPLTDLVLAVEPNLWPDCFSLSSLALDGQPTTPAIDGDRLTVKPAQPIPAGASVSLVLAYRLQIPAGNERYLFGYNASQTNLLDWYPFVVPYLPGQGWLLHRQAPVGEHLVYESADFDVSLRFVVPPGPLVVAAGAPAADAGNGATRYRLQGARGFPLSVSDRFLTSTVDAGGVRVTSYYFDGHQAAGARAADAAAAAVRLFAQKFAPYPYQSLSVVESASADGMEADGLFFMASHFYDTYDGTAENYLTALSVHETSHQWWYGLVGNDQALEPWLDEALATYSEWIFYNATDPAQIDWWWTFRIRRFDPVGAANADIYANGTFRTYTNASYFMGAYFLEDLRVRVGDEAFFAALSDYAQSNAHQIATSAAFFAALDRHTAVDYSDLLKKYFR